MITVEDGPGDFSCALPMHDGHEIVIRIAKSVYALLLYKGRIKQASLCQCN